MKLASLLTYFFLLAYSARADDALIPPAKLPISIKAVQVNSKVPETIQFEVVNSSTSTVSVDSRKLKDPGCDISKVLNEETDLYVSKGMSFSTDEQRVDLNHKPKLEWMISIPPGQTFTIELPAHKLLHDVDTRFLHDEIKVVFSVREFLLAVGGKETDKRTFQATCRSNEVMIKWH